MYLYQNIFKTDLKCIVISAVTSTNCN